MDGSLQTHENFIGLLEQSTEASVLLDNIHDVLHKIQCYVFNARIKQISSYYDKLHEEPRAIFTHCYGHSLNLACSLTVKQCKLMQNALDCVIITILIKNSPRRDDTFQRLHQ